MIVSRRGFIAGLTGIIAAPAIVRASSLMRVKPEIVDRFIPFVGVRPGETIEFKCDGRMYTVKNVSSSGIIRISSNGNAGVLQWSDLHGLT